MLVRTFRLTDKFSTAFLRISAWVCESLLMQLYQLRLALVESLQTVWIIARLGNAVYSSPEERYRAMMARRAEASARPAVREDPLRTQNRALSMFTVVLMATLIVVVLWFTNVTTPKASIPGNFQPGTLSLATTPPPFSTVTLTPTQVGVIQLGGSIVYSLRQNGHENLWATVLGLPQPVRLTNDGSDDRDPVWSPDGSKIAFASHRDGNWELYILNVATLEAKRLTYTADYEGAPTWSPDGKFLAFEGYADNNLDIYIIGVDNGELHRVTQNPAPDYHPAWSPDGNQIAYVSLRDGNAEIYVINLRKPDEANALRLTNTEDVEEDYPTWSPDGKTIAYSGRVNGYDLVFTKALAHPELDPAQIAQGRQAAWQPDGSSLLVALDNGPKTSFISAEVGTTGVMALAVDLPARANHPSWTGVRLQGNGIPVLTETPVYTEGISVTRASPPFHSLVQITGVSAPVPYLTDSVDSSFTALRQAVNQQAGRDFLGSLKEMTWDLGRRVEPGQPRQSWHYAGRAFDFDRDLVYGDPAPIEVVKEDIGVDTYWRVYIRVPDNYQGGQLGEPLKQLPWDFASRSSGDPSVFEEGGRKKAAVPSGYYVDFTQLAEDYGWVRVPSERTWRANFPSILYWEYDRRDNLQWFDAMLELYTQDQVGQFLSGPTPLPSPTLSLDTPAPTKTPTPVPPDKKSGP